MTKGRPGSDCDALPPDLPHALFAAREARTSANVISQAVKQPLDENKFNLSGVITGAASNLKFNFQ